MVLARSNGERSEAISLNHCCNTTNTSMNRCRLNQDLDLQLNDKGGAELTLMDTSTTFADVPSEVIVTDHLDSLDANSPAQNNISAR